MNLSHRFHLRHEKQGRPDCKPVSKAKLKVKQEEIVEVEDQLIEEGELYDVFTYVVSPRLWVQLQRHAFLIFCEGLRLVGHYVHT